MNWRIPTHDLEALESTFKQQVEQLLAESQSQYHLDLVLMDTYRDPWTQARLYRRSRSRKEIEEKVDWFDRMGFPWLGVILLEVGPQPGRYGKHLTYEAPGESWHQYQQAVDLCPRYDAKRLLSEVIDCPIERTKARLMLVRWVQSLEKNQLVWGGEQNPFHCQKVASPPLSILTADQVYLWGKEHDWWR